MKNSNDWENKRAKFNKFGAGLGDDGDKMDIIGE